MTGKAASKAAANVCVAGCNGLVTADAPTAGETADCEWTGSADELPAVPADVVGVQANARSQVDARLKTAGGKCEADK